MYFLSGICSLCLVSHQNIQSILSLDTDGSVIEEKLRPFLLEFMHFRPNVPKYICSNCLLDLNCIYKFRLRWLENITTLKKYIHRLEVHGSFTNLSVPLSDTKYEKKLTDQNNGTSYLKETDFVQGGVAMKSEFNEYENSNTTKKDNQINLSMEVKIENEATNQSFLENNVMKQELENITFQTPFEIFKEFNDEKDIKENVNISEELLNKKSRHIAKQRVSTNLKGEDFYISESEPFKDNGSDDEYLPSDDSSSATSESGDSDLDVAETQALNKIIESKETNSNLQEYATGEVNIKEDLENIYDDIDVKYEPLLPDNTSTDIEIKSVLKIEETNSEENLSRLNTSPRGTEDKANNCREVDNKELKQSDPVTKYNHTAEKSYKCHFYDKAFSQKSILIVHKRTHIGEERYNCDDCGKAFRYKSCLIKHKRRHTGEKPYKCDVCDKAFSQTCALITHKRLHTGEKPYKCNICEKAFTYLNVLINHKLTHTDEKQYICDVCDKAFRLKNNFIRHKRTHIDEKPYNCDVCDKAFRLKDNLIRHKRRHTDEKSYKCDVCDKAFSEKISLTRHKRTHTGEKPYKCDVCDKNFSVTSHLIRHKRTHTGEIPYKCDVCHKAFNQKIDLKRHKRTHTGEKPYKCDVCHKAFNQQIHLKRHKRTHTGEKPYKCDVCDKAFNSTSCLIIHKRTHTGEIPFKCDFCHKAFNRKIDLKRHKRTHTGKTLQM